MEQHVKMLAILHMIYAGLGLLIGSLVLVGGSLFSLIIGAQEDPVAGVVMFVVFVLVGLFVMALSLPGIVAGWGLLRYYNWARITAIVIGALNIMSFPIGTALGVYTLWVLINPDAERMFNPPTDVVPQ